MEAMTHTGNSANMAFYRERDKGPVWCQVLCSAMAYRDGKAIPKRPEYHFTVYRIGKGEVAHFTHKPRTSQVQTLPAQTVTRLVRKAVS